MLRDPSRTSRISTPTSSIGLARQLAADALPHSTETHPLYLFFAFPDWRNLNVNSGEKSCDNDQQSLELLKRREMSFSSPAVVFISLIMCVSARIGQEPQMEMCSSFWTVSASPQVRLVDKQNRRNCFDRKIRIEAVALARYSL